MLTISTAIVLIFLLIGVYFQGAQQDPELTNALASMNEEERAFFQEKILQIEEGMGEEQVTEIMGSDSVSGMELFNQSVHNWNCPGNRSGCLISMYFIQNRISGIRWINEGNYTIEMLYDN